MDRPGAVNKKFNKNFFIVTKFFVLINLFYILEISIFQGLIYKIKAQKNFAS